MPHAYKMPIPSVPPEIQLDVIDSFRRDHSLYTDAEFKHTMASLSRVCRLFREPAQRKVFSFLTLKDGYGVRGYGDNLLRWLDRARTGDKRCQQLASYVTTLILEDWTHVRHLRSRGNDSLCTPKPLIKILKTLFSTAAQFTQLVHLTMRHIPLERYSLRLIATFPQVREIVVEESDGPNCRCNDPWVLDSDFKAAPRSFSRIARLTFLAFIFDSPIPAAVGQLFEPAKLQKLHVVFDCAEPLFLGNAAMPVLEELHVEFPPCSSNDLLQVIWTAMERMPALVNLTLLRLPGYLLDGQFKDPEFCCPATKNLPRGLRSMVDAIAAPIHILHRDGIADRFQHVQSLTALLHGNPPASREDELDLKNIFANVQHMRYENFLPSYTSPILLDVGGQAAFMEKMAPKLFPAATRVTILDVIEWQKDRDGGVRWRPVILDRQRLKRQLEKVWHNDDRLSHVEDYDGCLAGVLSDPGSQRIRRYLGL